METLEELLYLLIPLLIFYVIGKLKELFKKAGGRPPQQPKKKATRDKLKQRDETLAAKRSRTLKKQPTLAQARAAAGQIDERAMVQTDEDHAELHSEEELMERYGVMEYERMVSAGELPAPKPRIVAAPAGQAVQGGAQPAQIRTELRDMILAKEILDPPLAFRRGLPVRR